MNLLMPKYTPSNKMLGVIVTALLLIAVLTGISACGQEEESVPMANLLLVNAAPNAFAFEVNDQRGELNVGQIDLLQNTNYMELTPGNLFLEILPNDANIPSYNLQIETLKNERYYSLFIMDTTTSLNHFMLVDDASILHEDTAQVRFVHASPDAPDFDLAALEIDTIFYENLTFAPTDSTKRFTAMIKMPIGNYNFEYLIADSSHVFFEVPFTLESQKKYTLYTSGKVNPDVDEQPFSVNVITHEF